MSDLEKDIEQARSKSGSSGTYDAATIAKIQKQAGKIVRKYEKDMAARLREEMIDDYGYCLHL